ncbi:fumarylacetoacetate hydrolase family protein [Gelria sp. Kuro-4]|uniref:fumarylacetoacetate hydrolase family protein n=1 Tax=Gelria sp. Kuro-4 TaxID=2796927 RepID=UPI001BF03C46|nr:fumarylacetoacetate hydrolase family protein [Gelria sp. Kuro-4]BCV23819.1 2-hydroxyhepta-2,4-diene-1,7-dioate isomerase [Gelria sp. Kuro-4]
MRLVRFLAEGKVSYGILAGEKVRLLAGDPFQGETGVREEEIPLAAVQLLAPCVPSKIVAVGLNYADHAAETGQPLPEQPMLFLKPPTAVVGPEEPVLYPAGVGRVDYEAELAVVIRDRTKAASPEEAAAHILGYTCLNDVTARDLQVKDVQWTRSKSYDTFAPLGPWIETELDPGDLAIKLTVNGVLKQNSSTRFMIFKVPQLVSFISQVMTLVPGDVIATGTPPGIGPVKPGDVMTVTIAGIGSLTNPVK